MKLIVIQEGREHEVELERREKGVEVRLGDEVFLVDSEHTNGRVRSLVIDGRQFELAVTCGPGGTYQVSHNGAVADLEVLDPLSYLAAKGEGGEKRRRTDRIDAYMPGRVVQVLVKEGEKVSRGQGLVVLEAMKMENEIQAEHDGVVGKVLVKPGDTVEGGDPLFEME